MSKRAKRREGHKLKKILNSSNETPINIQNKEASNTKSTGLKRFYESKYKQLLIIPFIILLLAIVQIGWQYTETGDVLIKDVSLKGGMTITIPTEQQIDVLQLETELISEHPETDFSVRSLSRVGKSVGIIIDTDIVEDQRDDLLKGLVQKLNVDRSDLSIEEIGSTLGASFFKQTLIAILIAFLFMGIVVFLYFRIFIPSFAVILSAFSDMIVTLAIANILGLRLSTAGIAAFLMLIGYSVDTDILLTIKAIKRTEGTLMERIYSAITTGLTMNMTTLAAITVALIFSQSEVLRQIMTILFIGLFVDMLNTWIQNVGIIRWYMEKYHHEKK